MDERTAMPDLYTKEQLEKFEPDQLVSLLMQAVKEHANGLAYNGLVRPDYFSLEKIDRWDEIAF